MIKATTIDSNYGVDEMGNVYSMRFNKRQLKGSDNGLGYLQLSMCKNGKQYTAPLVHRLVWEAHVGPVPAGMEIDHIDRNRANNALSNLQLVTHQQNLWNTEAKGYSWVPAISKWQARIKVGSKIICLGSFTIEEEAHAAYLIGKKAYHSIDGVGVEEALAQLAARPDGRKSSWSDERRAKAKASRAALCTKRKAQ